MEGIQEYIKQNKEILEKTLSFIDNEGDSSADFSNLIVTIQGDKLKYLLQIISKLSDNHHRCKYFFEKIIQILDHFKDQILQSISSIYLFRIFQSNILILYYLFDQKMLPIKDNEYISHIYKGYDSKGIKNRYHFYPCLRTVMNKNKLKQLEGKICENFTKDLQLFERNLREGENESPICSLIRNDSIEDFIIYVNKNNIPLNGLIKESINESNLLLQTKRPTLIEYSAFHGSIQIIKYLTINNVELDQSIWKYSIHSNNAELIYFLEEKNLNPTEEALEESIICHHNEIAHYLIDNYFYNQSKYKKFIYDAAVKSSNYEFFPTNLNDVDFHISSCKFKQCIDLFNVLLNEKIIDVDNLSLLTAAKLNNNADVVNILISKSNTILPENFFADSNITTITIPSSFISTYNCLFMKCKTLRKVLFKEISIAKTIKNYAFHSCFSLVSISIPSSVEYICKYAFYECTSLTEINIPNSVKSIGWSAFNGCSSLAKVIFQENSSLNFLGKSAFRRCKLLKKIEIPSSINTIESDAFGFCSKLMEISFKNPSQLKEIYFHTFVFCDSLKSITIPPSVTKIHNFAFHFCFKLEEVKILSPNTFLNDCSFYNCFSLKRRMIQPNNE